jgi:hypothetical protein
MRQINPSGTNSPLFILFRIMRPNSESSAAVQRSTSPVDSWVNPKLRDNSRA